MNLRTNFLFLASLLMAGSLHAHKHGSHKSDWPMWGNTPSRNMVGNASGIPVEIEAGERNYEDDSIVA